LTWKDSHMEQVAPGVYVETKYDSGNVGFITTGGGVICVDAPMLPRDVREWRAQIESVTDEPLAMLVQTDYDQVRVVGSHWLALPLIAHDTAWEKMKAYSSDKVISQINELVERSSGKGNWQVHMPDITFSERLMLYRGEREIHVLYGGGHSPATCMVYLPEQNLIFAGDAVYCDMHPSMTQAETKQWLSTLNQLRKMTVDLIIPGHGLPCDKEATQPLSEYIREMRALVRRNFQSGRSKSETSSAVIPELLDAFPFKESERDHVRQRIKGGSDRIYDEYRAAAKANTVKARGSSRKSRSSRIKQRS
jgi:cyclase